MMDVESIIEFYPHPFVKNPCLTNAAGRLEQ
jgi:hypothetical protein